MPSFVAETYVASGDPERLARPERRDGLPHRRAGLARCDAPVKPGDTKEGEPMNRTRKSRHFSLLMGAVLVAGLVSAAAIRPLTAAAATACPGGALTLATATSAVSAIGVDDDLELQLNGTTFFVNNDELASNISPIHFTAEYGDLLRVIASNSTIYGDHEYIGSLVLYCDANGNTQVLEPVPTEYHVVGHFGEVFYDRTFTIDFIDGDTTDPSVTITTPPDGAVYSAGQVVLADYACTDESGGSGIASCTGDVADGAAIDTSTFGPKTFTVVGTDSAGNSATATHAYTVAYDFRGFFQPIDNLPVVNGAKAGSAIPIKFSLGGDQGLAIFASGYPRSQVIACESTDAVDGVEETVTAGSSSLTYDATADQYVYVWKTDKSWAGTCRQLVVKLVDGTYHRANFQFK
jgi:hypothetical protein